MYSRVVTSFSAISLLLCIAIFILWARSFWHPMTLPVTRYGESCRMSIEKGAIVVDNEPQYLNDLANHHRDVVATELMGGIDLMAPPPWRVVPRWGKSSVLLLPMLIVGFAACATAPLAVRIRVKRMRRIKSLCAGCGYNLLGNTSGVCPECGKSR